MSVAIRAITRLQDADDVNVTPAVGVDEYALVYDHDTTRFVLRAPAAPFAGILATGATVGATAQAQTFTFGVVSPFLAPAADSTTAWQVRKADKTTAVVTVDTTNAMVGIGTTTPGQKLEVASGRIRVSDASSYIPLEFTSAAANNPYVNFSLNTASTPYGYIQVGDSADARALNLNPFGGNVGIGTSAPGAKLEASGEIRASRPTAESYLFVSIVSNANGNQLVGTTLDGYQKPIIFNMAVPNGNANTSNYYAFQVDNSEKVRITNTGNVGIGDTAPAEALDVTGNINTTGVIKVDDVQVLSNRVIDARCADVANSGDATTDGLIDALRDAMVAHGLIAAA